MLPAHQRFYTHNAAGGEVNLGLVVQQKFTPLQGAAHGTLHVQAGDGRGAHFWHKLAHAVAAMLFDAVHGDIGIAQQNLAMVAIAREDGDPNTGGHKHLAPHQLHRACQRRLDFFCHLRHVVWLGQIGEHNDKFITPQTCHGIGLTHTGGQPFGNLFEQSITHQMARSVVNQFEVVQVQQHHPHHQAVALGPGNGLLDAVIEQVAVGKPGQAVVVGLVLQRGLVLNAVTDVVDDAHKVRGGRTREVAHRGNVQLVPKQGAVFAVVAQNGLALTLFSQGVTDFFQVGLGQIVAHQKAPFQPHDLFGGVTGDALKSRVHVDDGMVVLIAAGDHDAVAAGGQRLLVQEQRLLGRLVLALDVRNVFFDHHQVGHLPQSVAQGGGNLAFPIKAAVFAAVKRVALPTPSSMRHRQQAAVNFGNVARQVPLECGHVGDVCQRVAGHGGEAGVGVPHLAVGVGHHNPKRALLHRQRQQLQTTIGQRRPLRRGQHHHRFDQVAQHAADKTVLISALGGADLGPQTQSAQRLPKPHHRKMYVPQGPGTIGLRRAGRDQQPVGQRQGYLGLCVVRGIYQQAA